MAVTLTEGSRRRKRRPPKLAPRYTVPNNKRTDASECHSTSRNDDESVALLREVFTTSTCRCFILKSFSDANFHKSLKYGIWSSTYAHNMMLDQVFQSDLSSVRPVLFFFSGIARMTSGVRTDANFTLWEKPKYEGFFHVEWLLVKDVPNHVLTDIKMTNTPSKKSITSCRDCEEVLFEEANRFISIFTEFPCTTSAWDDYKYFDQQEELLAQKRNLPVLQRRRELTDTLTWVQ